jgi:hypothetical protein
MKSVAKKAARAWVAVLWLVALGCVSSEPGERLQGYDWVFSDELGMPERRGIGGGEQVCQPVTTQTRPVAITIEFEPVPSFTPESRGQLLVFEYDPDVVDATSLCVGGGVYVADSASMRTSIEIPDDRPDLRYYATGSADLDGNGSLIDSCVDYSSQAFHSIETDRLVIPIVPRNCD